MAQQTHSSENEATSDEWVDYQRQLRDAHQPVSVFFDIPRADTDLVLKEISGFVQKLMAQFSSDERQRVLAFHHLIASTTNSTHSPQLDFPGEYCVLAFYNELASKYIRRDFSPAANVKGYSL